MKITMEHRILVGIPLKMVISVSVPRGVVGRVLALIRVISVSVPSDVVGRVLALIS